MSEEGDGRKQKRSLDFVIILRLLGGHDQPLRRSLRETDQLDLPRAGLAEHVIDGRRQVEHAHFVETFNNNKTKAF